jgi:hypothetical protein
MITTRQGTERAIPPKDQTLRVSVFSGRRLALRAIPGKVVSTLRLAFAHTRVIIQHRCSQVPILFSGQEGIALASGLTLSASIAYLSSFTLQTRRSTGHQRKPISSSCQALLDLVGLRTLICSLIFQSITLL